MEEEFEPQGYCGECIHAKNHRFSEEKVDWGDGIHFDRVDVELIDCSLNEHICNSLDWACHYFQRRQTYV